MGRMNLLLLSGLLIFLGVSESSLAQEGEAAPAAEGAKAEEAGKGPAPAKGPLDVTRQEVLDLQARLQGLKAKILSKKDALKKLIGEKQTIKDEKKSVEVFNNMKTEYKEMRTAIKEYDEQLAVLNYRYPEKGLTKERQYERIEIKTLDEMEREFSLEGKIKKTMVRVRQQFPEKSGPSPKAQVTENDAPKPSAAKGKDPSRSSVTESQLLSK